MHLLLQQQLRLRPDHFFFRAPSFLSVEDISVAEDVVVVVVVAEQPHLHKLYDALSIIYAQLNAFDSPHL